MADFAAMTDAELVSAVADPLRRDAAYRALYDRHAGRLMAFARSRFPRFALDATQETWLRAWTKLAAGELAGTNIRAWLFQVANRLCLDQARKRKTEPIADDVADRGPSVGEADERAEVAADRGRKIGHCLELLAQKSPDHAAALRAWQDGEQPEEFARRHEISVDNYYQRKKRALAALGRCAEQPSP